MPHGGLSHQGILPSERPAGPNRRPPDAPPAAPDSRRRTPARPPRGAARGALLHSRRSAAYRTMLSMPICSKMAWGEVPACSATTWLSCRTAVSPGLFRPMLAPGGLSIGDSPATGDDPERSAAERLPRTTPLAVGYSTGPEGRRRGSWRAEPHAPHTSTGPPHLSHTPGGDPPSGTVPSRLPIPPSPAAGGAKNVACCLARLETRRSMGGAPRQTGPICAQAACARPLYPCLTVRPPTQSCHWSRYIACMTDDWTDSSH